MATKVGLQNGMQPFTLVSALGTNPTVVQSGPTQLLALAVYNVNAAARFLKFYDSGVVAQTSGFIGVSAVWNVLVPGNTAGAGNNFAFPFNIASGGLQFQNGLAIQTTVNSALTDQSGVAAGDLIINLGYF